MKPIREGNSWQPYPPWILYLQLFCQKIVETTGGMIGHSLPTSIHSTTAQGFELKIGLFCLYPGLNFL
jgi:hypothetical protein